MSFNSREFDRIIPRRGSSCHKWDAGRERTGRDNLLPFWVADMDFAAAPPILEALKSRVEHGVFGYTFRPDSLYEALRSWFSRRHRWNIDESHILEAPGVVPFIHMLVQDFTNAGEAVIIQEPVYYPFSLAIRNNRRRAAVNPLKADAGGRWEMDLEHLSGLIDGNEAKMLILCSPHNPVGRVWKHQELLDLADLCRLKDVLVVSDEIHADLVFPGHVHIPWLSLPEDRLPKSIALISATKTFNIPGLTTAYAVIPDEGMRKRTSLILSSLGIANGSSKPLAYAASEAAWRLGEPWLEALLSYLAENDALLRETLRQNLPAAVVSPLEGTYLEWIDMRKTGNTDDEIWEQCLDAGIWPSRGSRFGQGGNGFLRMNIACPRSQLEQGLAGLTGAFTS